MRALGDALGVAPGAIYWHFSSKEEIVGAVSALVLSDIDVTDTRDRSWHGELNDLAHAMRRAMHRHPNVAPVFGTQILTSIYGATLAERIMTILAEAGFSGDDLVHAYNAFTGTVLGWVTVELSRSPTVDMSWRDGLRAALDGLDASEYPALAAAMPHARNAAFMLRWDLAEINPLDDAFSFTISVLLDGLRARLRQR
ncbi:MAG: TetR/AcrR family transcriptional regulator [Acidipropionibacterium sp.]|jgi:AcrR family transcriptional regulator|nr:TetR/AcrR family transcriptional regulator [Acidipropionibacterium sp.]